MSKKNANNYTVDVGSIVIDDAPITDMVDTNSIVDDNATSISAVVVEDLCFAYKRKNAQPVLQNLSFSVKAGEFVSLVGTNGSGKSTLCKLLQGIHTTPKNTTINICGYPAGSREATSRIIFTGGNETVPQFLTGIEYIRYLQKLTHNHQIDTNHDKNDKQGDNGEDFLKSKSKINGKALPVELIEEKFSALGMVGRAKDLIADYSHGMMKKVQLIASLLIAPPILIVDETLNGIDIESEEKLLKELATYTKKGGTVLLCSHNFELLKTCATRVLLLENGKLSLDKTNPIQNDWQAIKNQIINKEPINTIKITGTTSQTSLNTQSTTTTRSTQ